MTMEIFLARSFPVSCTLPVPCYPIPQGDTHSMHDGEAGRGSDVFFWVENFDARYFLGVIFRLVYFFEFAI